MLAGLQQFAFRIFDAPKPGSVVTLLDYIEHNYISIGL